MHASGDPPRISVCIPTYKGAGTIGAAIESVLAQDFGDFELIVVDDASPDDTRDVVGRYGDPRITYLRNERNLGPQGNWNRCLELARGHYFKLLPHDDLLYPGCLSRQAAVLDGDADERIALVFCARDVIGSDGRVLIKARGVPGGATGRLRLGPLLGACLRHGTNLIGEPGAVLCRRSLAQRVGSFDSTFPYVIDFDYWVRLLAHGDAFYDSEAMACFRVWRGSWSVAIGSGQSTEFRGFMARLADRGVIQATAWDRMCGRITPTLNNLARLLFYRLFVR